VSDEKKTRSKFPPLFWLVVMFEFFERGSYYGMMSVLSVYMTDILGFAKTDVGLIKGTIQPLLYFLPIISGALADRFGYRRMLMIAFSLLGGGYFLVAQATEYATVFLFLVVMGLGAGTFKPLISGTIARCTDESNSTLGFGIFYWSINLGAFLFPLFLVPFLKNNIGWDWVIMASAIGTGAMLLPTFFAFREPPKPPEEEGKGQDQTSMPQTLANAFEIIYSWIILLYTWMRRSIFGIIVVAAFLVEGLGHGGIRFFQPVVVNHTFSARIYRIGEGTLTVHGEPNLCKENPCELVFRCENADEVISGYQPGSIVEHPGKRTAELLQLKCDKPGAVLSFFNPNRLGDYAEELENRLNLVNFAGKVSREDLTRFRDEAVIRTTLQVRLVPDLGEWFEIEETTGGRIELRISDIHAYRGKKNELLRRFQNHPRLAVLAEDKLDELAEKAGERGFTLLFAGLLFAGAMVVLRLARAYKASSARGKLAYILGTLGALYLLVWLLPGISLLGRIICSILSVTLLSLYAIDTSDIERFRDHWRFLLMVLIYSGFWVLYFQMFDSVLWYVQAYVDPTSLNQSINGFFASLGLDINWHFDVEHVTVINAGTIILLQLVISNIVKNIKALPTMIAGIALGTLGMGILAISTGIWVFICGIIIFSIGEMTAHPKFISYVGQTAPKSRVAMYMGYLFLYGVIGSSFGAPIGANLYVTFVDELNQPRTLWLIFAGIGVATIVGLLLYNKFVAGKQEEEHGVKA
jgi:dipeptide/tripeptide permease